MFLPNQKEGWTPAGWSDNSFSRPKKLKRSTTACGLQITAAVLALQLGALTPQANVNNSGMTSAMPSHDAFPAVSPPLRPLTSRVATTAAVLELQVDVPPQLKFFLRCAGNLIMQADAGGCYACFRTMLSRRSRPLRSLTLGLQFPLHF